MNAEQEPLKVESAEELLAAERRRVVLLKQIVQIQADEIGDLKRKLPTKSAKSGA